jgi:hypothetical protein
MREICLSGSKSGMRKRSHVGTTKAPPDERGCNRNVLPNATVLRWSHLAARSRLLSGTERRHSAPALLEREQSVDQSAEQETRSGPPAPFLVESRCGALVALRTDATREPELHATGGNDDLVGCFVCLSDSRFSRNIMRADFPKYRRRSLSRGPTNLIAALRSPVCTCMSLAQCSTCRQSIGSIIICV